MGSGVRANELVRRHRLVSLVALSSATVSSLSAIKNKVCDTVLYTDLQRDQNVRFFTECSRNSRSVEQEQFFLLYDLNSLEVPKDLLSKTVYYHHYYYFNRAASYFSRYLGIRIIVAQVVEAIIFTREC